MIKPNDYDNTQVLSGSSQQLPAGGYVCRIKNVVETASRAGTPMLKVALDVAEGEFEGHFLGVYEGRMKFNRDAKWPCVSNQVTTNKDGSTNRGFKTFCEAVVESNGLPGVPWGDQFCSVMKGKTVGVLFGREEFAGSDGKHHWAVKPKSWKTVDEIRNGDFTVPEDVPLKRETVSSADIPDGFAMIDDSDIPF